MEKTIISSISPLTGLTAEVIVENDCSYFYLYQAEAVNNESVSESALRDFSACWIKNHVKVDDIHSPQDDIKKGMQPKIPTKYCAYEDDLELLKEEELEIVWGKEGTMAALYESGELICVIPYWADLNFSGYSKYSRISEVNMVPSPLGNSDSNALFQRMEEAKEFWKQDFDHIWRDYQKSYLSELKSKYGEKLKYYAIDGGKFPPRALAIFEKDSVKYAFTLGAGMFPQPKADIQMEDYRNYELFEMAFCYPEDAGFDEKRVFSQISSIVSIPWASNTFLDHSHTVDLRINAQYNNAVIVADSSVNMVQSKFLKERDINLLWLVPITDEDYEKLAAGHSDITDVVPSSLSV